MAEDLTTGVPITDLRPTQMTVGLREVSVKRRLWREADDHGRERMLRRHVVPIVVGPKGRRYVVDHHHLARALLEEKAPALAVFVLADLEHLPKNEFWSFMDNSAWCHAYDEEGKRRDLSDIPKSLSDMADDPFRSLAGELIRAGGCAKSDKPFSEFRWADFMRRRIDRHLVENEFGSALVQALVLAKSRDARALPGWCGPDPG